jgi:hypothetical protein
VLNSVVSSRERQQRAKLAELDVDIEQWRELQASVEGGGA